MEQNDALGKLGGLLTTPGFRGSFARNPLDALRDAGMNPQDIDPGVLSALSELTAAELRILAQVGHALRESGVDAPTALRMV
jgi:hypothetical protein